MSSRTTDGLKPKPPVYRCRTCGETFTAWAPAQAHEHATIEYLPGMAR